VITVLQVLRYVVFALFVLAVIAAAASWLVRERHVSPFSRLGRVLRSLSDPLLQPVETRLARMGGSPVNAGWWLIVVVAVVGVVTLSLLGWLTDQVLTVQAAARGGVWGIMRFIIYLAYEILFIALLVRVVASWFGAFRYNRWLRPFYALTDWLVEPIRKVLPTVGMFDLSPLVALLALWAVKSILLSVLPG
jgi:YggT family protein